MPIALVTGPANAGKAQLVLEAVRAHVAHGEDPLLVVPTEADQARYRRELAETGSALGVRVERFEGLDACVAPVLSPTEAPDHPHHRSRDGFLRLDGVPQPAPAPRFSRSTLAPPRPPEHPGAATAAALAGWGFDHNDVASLTAAGVLV